jgi:hypothetical protein
MYVKKTGEDLIFLRHVNSPLRHGKHLHNHVNSLPGIRSSSLNMVRVYHVMVTSSQDMVTFSHDMVTFSQESYFRFRVQYINGLQKHSRSDYCGGVHGISY